MIAWAVVSFRLLCLDKFAKAALDAFGDAFACLLVVGRAMLEQ